MRNGANLMIYLGDKHRKQLDKIGAKITEGKTKRGVKSKAVRHLLDEYKKQEAK